MRPLPLNFNKTTLPTTISITAIASISGLGNDQDVIWQNYLNDNHSFVQTTVGNQNTNIAPINSDSKKLVSELKKSDTKYKSLDNSVLFAIATSRKAIEKAGWQKNAAFGINIGSSRGATELFEKHHLNFIQSGKVETLASPTTTLGNISSWVSHDLQSQGPEISHSITCSTALHALLNGIAWLKSGMADKFLVGGSEAPLTDFTIAQMRALKIYSKNNDEFPCRALDLNKKQNSLVLGEGAAVCCLEMGRTDKTIAVIEGIGYATEILEHNVSVSAEATCFQKSMQMAIGDTKLSEVDAIVMHAPGTIKGDLSEYKAIQKIFGAELPLLTTNKWKIGHTFGASGMLSIEMAILMLQNQTFIGVPFAEAKNEKKPMKKIMVNAVGFGGNAVSILLSL